MGTIKVRFFGWIAKDGERTFIDASEYIPDERDVAYGGGKPPGWFLPKIPSPEYAVKKPEGSVEFDHKPTEEEIVAALKEQKNGGSDQPE